MTAAPDPRGDKTLNVAFEAIAESSQSIWLPVRGNSMLPLLRAGDHVLVSPSRPGLTLGDIVVYQRQGDLFIHRLLAQHDQNEAGLLIKGDNRLLPDPLIRVEDILGRAVKLRREQRMMSLETPAWRLINKVIARMMLFQANFLCPRTVAHPEGSDQFAAGWRSRLGRLTLWALAPILRLAGYSVGRWED